MAHRSSFVLDVTASLSLVVCAEADSSAFTDPNGHGESTTSITASTVAAPARVSERLGHSPVSFTLDTYGHVMPGQQAEAAEAAALLTARAPTQH